VVQPRELVMIDARHSVGNLCGAIGSGEHKSSEVATCRITPCVIVKVETVTVTSHWFSRGRVRTALPLAIRCPNAAAAAATREAKNGAP